MNRLSGLAVLAVTSICSGCGSGEGRGIHTPVGSNRSLKGANNDLVSKTALPPSRPLQYKGMEGTMIKSPGLSMVLNAAARQRRDLVKLELSVINHGDHALTWDREFSFFIHWYVTDESGTYANMKRIGNIPTISLPESAARFVMISPNRTISKEIALSKGVQIFSSASAWTKDGTHVAVGAEEMVRFVVPDSSQGIYVEAEYSLIGDEQGAFSGLIGKTVDQMGLPKGSHRSNKLYINITN